LLDSLLQEIDWRITLVTPPQEFPCVTLYLVSLIFDFVEDRGWDYTMLLVRLKLMLGL